jgi:transposase
MTTETRKRSSYTEDFKREAVALVTEQGYKIAEAARSLDIGANLLGRWRRQIEEEARGAKHTMSRNDAAFSCVARVNPE